jgi:hypothetical protein
MTSKFSSTSIETTLQNAIATSGATTMVVATGTGSALMGGVSLAAGNVDVFTVAIDVDTINEEIVFITNVSSDTMTIVRGRAGTSAVTHTAGATVKHVLSSYDLNNFQSTVAPVANIAFAGSTSGTTTVQATAVAGTTTLTLPAATDTLVGRATADTLTNKTLTAPVISTISNTGTLTLPTATDTLVGRATTDTLTNKTLTAPVINLATNAQTGTTYTAVLADNGKIVEMNNASANTFTVPLNSSVAYPIGAQINLLQTGAGQTTVVATGGVTINATPGLKLRTQWSSGTLIKRGTDTWVLLGDLSA